MQSEGIYCMVKDGRLAAVRLSNRRLLFTEESIQEAILNAECQGVKTVSVRLQTYQETL